MGILLFCLYTLAYVLKFIGSMYGMYYINICLDLVEFYGKCKYR